MTRMTLTAISAALAMALTAGYANSQEQPADEGTAQVIAENIANQAISELAAWKNKSARKILQKGRAKYGSTPEFQTAWALLEIQEGADDDQKQVDKGIKSLTRMTKKKSVDAVATLTALLPISSSAYSPSSTLITSFCVIVIIELN
jgi:hypothetical protein